MDLALKIQAHFRVPKKPDSVIPDPIGHLTVIEKIPIITTFD